jgi:ubiquitin-like modifier-activating enzyme ATG7
MFFLSHLRLPPSGQSYERCTACSSRVVAEWASDGFDMVEKALNHTSYLDDLTGLSEIRKEAALLSLDWDEEEDLLNEEEHLDVGAAAHN